MPVFFIEWVLDTISSKDLDIFLLLFIAFIIAGFTEELFKLLSINQTIYITNYFEDELDGIIYTGAASMGFAFVENLIYSISSGIMTSLYRSFTAVPGHLFFSTIMGFYIGRSKQSKTKSEKLFYYLVALLIGTFLHGVYDFIILTGVYSSTFNLGYDFISSLIFPYLVLLLIILIYLIKTSYKLRASRNKSITKKI